MKIKNADWKNTNIVRILTPPPPLRIRGLECPAFKQAIDGYESLASGFTRNWVTISKLSYFGVYDYASEDDDMTVFK